MNLGVMGSAGGELRALFEGGSTAGLSDGQLLDRFASGRGDASAEAAFAALVARHGPMVWGTCRRILRDTHAAEDAFQATFLVLVRKARSVRVDDSLGRWLHGVGVRVALRARASAGRRAGSDLESVDPSRLPGDLMLLDLRAAIDEEVDRLPPAYRSVVVLCHLEGLTRERAASRLGCPVGDGQQPALASGRAAQGPADAPRAGAWARRDGRLDGLAGRPAGLARAVDRPDGRPGDSFRDRRGERRHIARVRPGPRRLEGDGRGPLAANSSRGCTCDRPRRPHSEGRRVLEGLPIEAPVAARAPALEAAVPPGDPTIYRGGPDRAGYYPGLRPIARPATLWTTPLDGMPGEPIVASGVVYVGDSRFDHREPAKFYAIRAEDGAILWRHEDEGNPVVSQITAAPLVVGDRVYYTSRSGLTALAGADGSRIWHLPIAASIGACESSPLLVDGRLLIAAGDGRVHAVDARTGRPAWTSDLLADAPPSPPGRDDKQARMRDDPARPTEAASDGATLFQSIFDQGRLVAIDARTGERRWSFATRGWMNPGPMVVGSNVIVGSQDGGLYGLDKATGRERWRFAAGSMIQAGAATDGESIYFGSCDGVFHRLEAASGREAWSSLTGIDPRLKGGGRVAIYSAPVLGEDVVHFGSEDGHLYALKLDGTLRWKHKPVADSEILSTPCTDGRKLYVASRRRSIQEGRNAVSAIGESAAARD